MYEITCPYCEHDNFCWEVDKAHGMYVPHMCDNCKKIWYLFQRSWFDITYDTGSVEVKTQAEIEMIRKAKKLIKSATLPYGNDNKKVNLYIRKYNEVELAMKQYMDNGMNKAIDDLMGKGTGMLDGLDGILDKK